MHSLRLPLSVFAIAAVAMAQAPANKQPRPPITEVPTKVAPMAVNKTVLPGIAPTASTPVVAKDHAAGPAAAFPLPPTVVHDVAADGSLWARGVTWKARFDGTSFTYIPALGSAAAHNWPLTLQLAEVHSGSESLAVTAGTPQRDGNRITAPHGSCIEHFDLLPTEVEQSWVFTTLPTRGELRLAIAVTTALQAAEHGADLAFTGPDGGVRYERAVAVDARGARQALELQLHGNRIELVVPAAFVASATLPLVVDPFTVTTPLSFTAVWQGNADLASDYTTQEFMVVWQHAYSATDHDLWAQRLDLAQAPVGVPFAIDFTSVSWAKPRVANNGIANNFLVVAECSQGFVSPFWIGGRIWSVGGGALAAFDVERSGVGGSFSGDAKNPDVGGDPLELGPTYFTVVWEREFNSSDHDIVMRQITDAGVLRTSAPTAVDLTSTFQSRPRISKSNGYSFSNNFGLQHWTIVYQQTYSPTDEDVRGSQITWDGQFVLGTPNYSIAASGADELSPVASSPTDEQNAERFHMVAFVRRIAGANTDIVTAVWDRNLSWRTEANLQTLEVAGAAQAWPQGSPSIDCDGVRFAVAYAEVYGGSGGDFDVRASTVAFDALTNGLLVHEARSPLAVTGIYEGNPTVASAWSGGGGAVDYGVAFQDYDAITTTHGIHATVYRGHASGLPMPSVRASGCGTLGISMADLPALGRSISFFQTDAGPLTGFVFGIPTAVAIPVCPSCLLGVDGVLVPNPFGITVPLSIGLVGQPFSCQAWSFATGPCLGAIALSDTIDFTIL